MPQNEPITKEELYLFTDVLKKNTEQMTLVAQQLQRIADGQEKMNGRLYNGMAKEIQEGVTKALAESLLTVRTNQSTIMDNQKTIITKIFSIGNDISGAKLTLVILTIVVALALAIQQFIHWMGHGAVTKAIGG